MIEGMTFKGAIVLALVLFVAWLLIHPLPARAAFLVPRFDTWCTRSCSVPIATTTPKTAIRFYAPRFH